MTTAAIEDHPRNFEAHEQNKSPPAAAGLKVHINEEPQACTCNGIVEFHGCAHKRKGSVIKLRTFDLGSVDGSVDAVFKRLGQRRIEGSLAHRNHEGAAKLLQFFVANSSPRLLARAPLIQGQDKIGKRISEELARWTRHFQITGSGRRPYRLLPPLKTPKRKYAPVPARARARRMTK